MRTSILLRSIVTILFARRVARKTFLINAYWFALPLLVIGGACAPSTQSNGRSDVVGGAFPNVIIISLDTTRVDFLGCYGNNWVKTPNIDRFAEAGILFERCFTPAPATLAAHTSIMTGTYPHTHGVSRNGTLVHGENVMLAEVLNAVGYQTVGLTSAPPLASRYGFPQGFEYYDDELLETGARGVGFSTFPERSAETISNAALSFLENRVDMRPLFMFVHYYDPHHPYIPIPKYLSLYDDEPDTEVIVTDSLISRIDSLTKGEGIEQLPRLIYRYAAEISYMDHYVGALLDGLEHSGLLENAIVILTSDHGETLWDEEPYFSHTHTVDISEIRTVGVVRLPDRKHANSSVEVPVSLIDWMPSILGYLGLPIPSQVEGRDLHFGSGARDISTIPIYSQAISPHTSSGSIGWNAIDNARCVVDYPRKLTFIPDSDRWELYDLGGDLFGRDQIYDGRGSIPTDRNSRRLAKLLERWAQSAAPLSAQSVSRSTDEARELLKAMGYL